MRVYRISKARHVTTALPSQGAAQTPGRWHTPAVQRVGDQWIAAGAALALRVPSAVARYDSNILINPAHPRFADVVRASDDDLALDSRLFGQD